MEHDELTDETRDFWVHWVRLRLGDDEEASYAIEKQVREVLAHPGWEFLNGLIEQQKQIQVSALLRRQPLEHISYVGASRAALAFEQAQGVGLVVLGEIERRRAEREKAAAERGEEELT